LVVSTRTARYRSLSSRLKGEYGEAVRKITLDAGLGCPNRDGTVGYGGCLYCNPTGSGTGAHAEGLSIAAQVDRGIEFLSRRYKCRKFISYFQAFTNTYAPVDRLADIYGEALRRPEVVGLAVGTRPDCVPDPVLDLLGQWSSERLVWIELGLQSVHKKTLELIRRGHSPEVFFDAVRRAKFRGIEVVAHLILGLPGESLEDMTASARAVAEAGVDGVKIHPLYVIRGTGLERMLNEGQYRPLSERDAIEATLAVLQVIPPDMVIHRLTSDPHKEELVAPRWMLDRKSVRHRLDQALEEHEIRQGAFWPDKALRSE
jgi:radical SAM protein (TIGR01212 family)